MVFHWTPAQVDAMDPAYLIELEQRMRADHDHHEEKTARERRLEEMRRKLEERTR